MRLRVIDLYLFGLWLCVVWQRAYGEALLSVQLFRSTYQQRRRERTLSLWRWERCPGGDQLTACPTPAANLDYRHSLWAVDHADTRS